ncbi:hypothetical protein LguiA_035357 [Lonicera macranthoides]
MSSGGARVSIPSSVRKMIHNIKEITGKHSEEEIYAMLKECSMDPNETAQKLLLQDTFHEVKRKRDRRKEHLNKESAESRWKPGMQGRGVRGGRGNYSSHYIPDAVGGRKSASGKENVTSQVSEDSVALSTMPIDTKNKEVSSVVSSSTVITDGSTRVASESTSVVHARNLFLGGGVKLSERTATAAIDKSETPPPLTLPVEANKNTTIEFGTERDLTAVTASLEVGRSFVQGKTPIISQGVGKNQIPESSRPAPSTHGGSFGSRPSSNYSSRSQVIAPQKVGPTKEWKPKPTNPSICQGPGTGISSQVPAVTVEASIISEPALKVLDSTEATSELEKKLELSHLSDRQHVIIPNHLHVLEAEKLGFCFGSFGASFGLNTSYTSGPESEKSPLSESSEAIEESVEEQSSSNQVALANSGYEDYPDPPPSSHVPENLSSSEGDAPPSTVVPQYNESKQETALLPGGHQHSAVHASPNYSFGFVPPILGSHLARFENIESQAHDVPHIPSFVVQQPLDPTSYYGQFYRPGADSDGHISPFHSPVVATKYNNGTVLPPQASQSSQEGGSSLHLSIAGPTPLVTQAGGVMQSSIAASQQPLPVFRQPPHLPHFHPNYIPYAHYYSQFYVPPPAIQQYLSSGAAFPQHPQAGGNVYPAPSPVATANKYSLSQYKPGTNTGNSTCVGVPGSYGPYGSSPASYNPGSAATAAANGTSHEDLTSSQFKENNNVYIAGQQNEGSGVWITAQGRDLSGLPASSFYNLPQGGQLAAFTPAQAGHHGTFAGIYHHPAAQPVTAAGAVHPLLQQSQTMAGPVDMVGPTASVYQQPQPAQINWPNNY